MRILLLFGQFVHLLWNWLMPSLLGLHGITYWQAVGLMALSWLLFGGWRGFGGHRHCGRGGGHWKRHMSDRWRNMPPEDREKFRDGMRTMADRMKERCGRRGGEGIPPQTQP
jgi:hypothetical protein